MICKAELQSIMHEETLFAMFRVHRNYFESGDKADKMLALESFFHNISLPTLKEEEGESLEAPVTEMEIFSALKAFLSGKAPSNDGFTIALINASNITYLHFLLYYSTIY